MTTLTKIVRFVGVGKYMEQNVLGARLKLAEYNLQDPFLEPS